MLRSLLLWLLLGALGLTGYDAYRNRTTLPQPKSGGVHTQEGGNGLPPPKP